MFLEERYRILFLQQYENQERYSDSAVYSVNCFFWETKLRASFYSAALYLFSKIEFEKDKNQKKCDIHRRRQLSLQRINKRPETFTHNNNESAETVSSKEGFKAKEYSFHKKSDHYE